MNGKEGEARPSMVLPSRTRTIFKQTPNSILARKVSEIRGQATIKGMDGRQKEATQSWGISD